MEINGQMTQDRNGCVPGYQGLPTQAWLRCRRWIIQVSSTEDVNLQIAIAKERETILRPFTPHVSFFVVLLFVDLPPPA